MAETGFGATEKPEWQTYEVGSFFPMCIMNEKHGLGRRGLFAKLRGGLVGLFRSGSGSFPYNTVRPTRGLYAFSPAISAASPISRLKSTDCFNEVFLK